ncbi:hypothetical protein K525DRAFT_272735 [Schizophyllum commune Loenen D]|nr:hypothetical protein K525DRAFT_272735 [Schizophyllum commune Loenen D]
MQAASDPSADAPSTAASASRAVAPARAFEAEELKALNLGQLRQIIKDQVDNIREPLPKTLKLSKASKPKVIATLLDPKYGFQTREPKLTFEAGYGVRKHVQHARRGRAPAAGRRSSTGLVQAQAGMPTFSLAGPSDTANTTQGLSFFDPPLDIPPFNIGTLGGGQPPVESSVAQLYSLAPAPFQTLIVYIRDVRDAAIGELTVPDRVEVKVPVTYTKHDKYIADWHDIIREIQGTASAIRGRYAKVSYSRSYQDDFKIAILQADGMRIQDVGITHPSLVLDDSPQYCLHVDPLKDPVRRRASSPEVAAAHETLQRLSSLGPDNKEDANAQDYDWLQGELRKRAGYGEFRDAKHNTKMPFAEVIEQWGFAVAFLDEFKGCISPYSKRRVRKRDIQEVLDRGQTWLIIAKNGYRLHKTYRDHPELVAALANPEAKGYDELYQLLNRISK